jgi:hypothetical protein
MWRISMKKLMKTKNEIDSRKKMKRKINNSYINKIFLISIIVLILVAAVRLYNYTNGKDTIVSAVNFEPEEIMRVNNDKIVMNEFLLYAADVYQGYNLQNEADWKSEVTDQNNNIVTFEDQVKGTICEQIRMTKILCMKALDEGITLSDDERKILLDNANTYYADLAKASAVNEALTIELITKFYEENALAQKVYNSILNGYELNQSELAINDNDDTDSDLTDKELYFIEIYHNLAEVYDKEYDYYTSINWNLLSLLSFSELSKDEDSNTGLVSDAETVENERIVVDQEVTSETK